MEPAFTRPSWVPKLIKNLRLHLDDDDLWSKRIDDISTGPMEFGLHLAIFVEPYLQYILEGKKTVESRFGVHRYPPFGYVREGDVLLLKKSGGPIMGICLVGQVWFYHLDAHSWRKIKQDFSSSLCAQDPEFWNQRRAASYATLMLIKDVRPITPFEISKKDRRGWVTLKNSIVTQELLFA
jgi:hypothetical protein